MRSAFLLLPLAITLAGCAGQGVGRWISRNHPACETIHLGWAIGQPATRGTAKRMMRISRARDLRWIQPDRVAARGVHADRLTVRLGIDRRIVAVSCG